MPNNRFQFTAVIAIGVLVLGACTNSATQQSDSSSSESFRKIKLVLVAADRLPEPIGLYKGDGNPLTLEIVDLTEKSDGTSRITPDAEVVFFYRASASQRIKLIQQAINAKVAREIAGN